MADVEKIKDLGVTGITGIRRGRRTWRWRRCTARRRVARRDALAERCLACKSKAHVVYDELIGETGQVNLTAAASPMSGSSRP